MTDHTCHWPGCSVPVEPKYWGCRDHWFALPGHLRGRIWTHYRPGQEISKKPSPEYVAAARAVQDWIAHQGAATGDLFGGMPQGP